MRAFYLLSIFLLGLAIDVDEKLNKTVNRSRRKTEDFRKTVGDEDWVPSLDLYERFNQAGKGLKEVKEDVLEAFRWDIDCPFLNEVDLQLRQRQGRCAPDLPAEEDAQFSNSSLREMRNKVKERHEKHKRKRLFLIQDTKKHLLNFASFGKLRTPPKTVKETGGKFLIIDGHWLTLRCPLGGNETTKIEQCSIGSNKTSPTTCSKPRKQSDTEQHATWIVNGNTVEYRHYEWRLKVDRDLFEVFPVVLNDSGIFECWFEGQMRGFVEVEVISHWELIRRGMANYGKVNVVYLLMFVTILFHVWRRPERVFKKSQPQKWSDAYLGHKLNDNVERAKENVARKYYGDDLEKQKEMLKNKEFTARETAAMNRQILQTILDGCQNST
ncbi:unnamed protein product, partial [Mesorhabditis belari]|uniref:Ig-like domain-containing protein n=1 Tax=Mesorhabditis belari TaxID=2138241 RepID=A0AAF3F1S8_9BILA